MLIKLYKKTIFHKSTVFKIFGIFVMLLITSQQGCENLNYGKLPFEAEFNAG